MTGLNSTTREEIEPTVDQRSYLNAQQMVCQCCAALQGQPLVADGSIHNDRSLNAFVSILAELTFKGATWPNELTDFVPYCSSTGTF